MLQSNPSHVESMQVILIIPRVCERVVCSFLLRFSVLYHPSQVESARVFLMNPRLYVCRVCVAVSALLLFAFRRLLARIQLTRGYCDVD
jgi:hypothetical protein